MLNWQIISSVIKMKGMLVHCMPFMHTGTQVVLLKGEGASAQQSAHGSGEALVGELALVAPCLGWSQRLLNRDHYTAYYQVE